MHRFFLASFLCLVTASPLLAQVAPAKNAATPAGDLTVLPGFKVELLRSADDREGSWISLAKDGKGRLYVSPQEAIPESGYARESTWGGIRRVTLGADGTVAAWDKVPSPVGGAMGMLWAYDSLYVSGMGPDGQAIYRLKDGDGNDTLEHWELFKKVPGGGGEHGAHALKLGPDGKIYIIHGNSTALVEGIAPDSPFRHYGEDDLLPRIKDPVATFFDNLKTPYGHILRTDETGSRWELFAAGMRNAYDLDFSPDGELFTYDSDMEWDVGLPWYRPTRVLHLVSGADYGFREGNSKHPEYYEDDVPAVVQVGLGSPTGVTFGTGARFPAKYRRAFFALDWTFGRILAVHQHPSGAGYRADNPLGNPFHLAGPSSGPDVENFLSGKGLPVSDLEIGRDGAMYFITGGRGTQSGLYRVTWTAPLDEPPAANGAESTADIEARALRRKLEAFHGREDAAALPALWPHLGSPDRLLRNAARVALESQPVAQWREKALAETNPPAALEALLALARVGEKTDQTLLLKALAKFPLDSLDEPLKLVKLRVIELSFARQGKPEGELLAAALEKLGRQYPAKSYALNRELSQLLAFLEAPDLTAKTLPLLAAATDPAEQVWFASVLRLAKNWTPEQRKEYFAWFAKAKGFQGGNSAAKFIERIAAGALANVPEAERAPFKALADAPAPKPDAIPIAAKVRGYNKDWKVADLTGSLDAVGDTKSRDLLRGREIFTSTACFACHHFGATGGNVGPDLTAVSSRFSRKDILEAIIEPSKVISEQYLAFTFTLKDGKTLFGQIAGDNGTTVDIIVEAFSGKKETVAKADIVKKDVSPVSLMPPGLLNVLSREEVLDLLAYLETAGK